MSAEGDNSVRTLLDNPHFYNGGTSMLLVHDKAASNGHQESLGLTDSRLYKPDFTNVIRAQQFSPEAMAYIFAKAREMKQVVRYYGSNILSRRVMATLFYEPSTRTRLSFESAMNRLGGDVISTENAREFSSASKGETLEDTIRTVNGYADLIVLRHDEEGASERAAAVSGVPIINAGDGTGQHPTQALLDVFTIEEEIDRLDGISIAMVGDLANGRTVRSLCYLLSKFSNQHIYFVAPPAARMNDDIKEHLSESGVHFEDIPPRDFHSVAAEVDVIYQTRIQKERFVDEPDKYEQVKQACKKLVIDKAVLGVMGEESVIMHPLPRVDEIKADEVDEDPRAAYFRQAHNGLFVRMALLSILLETK
jgi:aspartate carbamoyltransferase catalytic subunit